MDRTWNRPVLFTLGGFLAAPAVPALAALVTTTPGASLVVAAAVYQVALLISIPIAAPALFVLRKRNLINARSATVTGALTPMIPLLAFQPALPTAYFMYSALGGLSGFVFWLVWRMGHRAQQNPIADAGASRTPGTGARHSTANIYSLWALGLFLLGWGWAHWHSRQLQNFDATAWRENVHDNDSGSVTPRHLMADGLLRSSRLLGKTRGEVEALLGPDSDSSYFQEYDLVYWLGPERSFVRIDSEWLVIDLDNEGVVADVRIVTD